jgi:hypothetical protein
VTGSYGKTVRVWSLLKKRIKIVLKDHIDNITSVGVTSNNNFMFFVVVIKLSKFRIFKKNAEKLSYKTINLLYKVAIRL